MDTQVLQHVPTLGGLYAQALARQAGAAVRRSQPASQLPNVAYEVYGVEVGVEHLSSYQHLVGERADDVLPAGYVHVVGFPVAVAVMARPDFPLPLLGLVHIENQVEYSRPLRLGNPLRVRAWAQNLAAHHRGTQVELVLEVGTQGEEADWVAWRGVSTYLARGLHIPGLPEAEAAARAEDDHPIPTAHWELTPSTGREYAKISGDINPIHTSALGAKAFGFPRAIAHGMYTASRALAEVGPGRGQAFRWTVEFASPVLLPGRVNVAITPEERSTATNGPHAFTYRGWGGRLNFTGRVDPI